MKLLFVCTGNSCRSVIAQKLCEKMAAARGLDVKAKSCGTAANPDFPTPADIGLVLGERGIKFMDRRPVPVSAGLASWADVILAMTTGHHEQLLNQYPEYKSKIKLFLEFAGGTGNVPDPIGQRVEIYRNCRDTIEKGLTTILEKHAANSH